LATDGDYLVGFGRFGTKIRCVRRKLYQDIVTVREHLNGGFTTVIWPTGHHIDIRTEEIPPHLRQIGARFILRFEGLWPEASDSAEELQKAARDPIEIEELPN